MPLVLLLIGASAALLLLVLLSRRALFVPPSGLAYGKDLEPEERAKLLEIGRALQIDPSFLTSIAKSESGLHSTAHLDKLGTQPNGKPLYRSSVNPALIGPQTIGGGLIGFMRPTAASYGLTLEQLLALPRLAQWDYVKEFFYRHRKSGVLPPNPSLWRTYMSAFYPAKAYLADSPTAELFAELSPVPKERKAYLYNYWLDRNHDGEITIGEAMAKIQGIYENGLKPSHRW